MHTNTSTVKRQRVSRSGRSRTVVAANAANKRRRNANSAARRHKLLGLLILAHLAARSARPNTTTRNARSTRPRANTRNTRPRRPLPKGI